MEWEWGLRGNGRCQSLSPVQFSATPGSVHRILQARILEWIAILFFRGSSWPRDRTHVSCIAGRFFTIWEYTYTYSCLTSLYGRNQHNMVKQLTVSQFSHSVVSNSATPWTAARQASLSITNSQSLLKFMSIESEIPSNITDDAENAALDMPAYLESSAVATGIEKVSFHSNPKERQCQRMFKLPHSYTHLTHQQSNAQNSPSQALAICELWTSRCSSWI